MKLHEKKKIIFLQSIEENNINKEIIENERILELSYNERSKFPELISNKQKHKFFLQRSVNILNDSKLKNSFYNILNEINYNNKISLILPLSIIITAIIGLLISEVGKNNIINILSIPIIGIIVWNLIIYINEIILLLKNERKIENSCIYNSFKKFILDKYNDNKTQNNKNDFKEIRDTFYSKWLSFLDPIIFSKSKILFHLLSITLAISLIAGMYIKGFSTDYRVIWESTFFKDSTSLRPFLKVLFFPATFITKEDIPSVENLEKIHWFKSKNEVVGSSASIWIHWYSITICFFVVIPRIIFLIIWKLKELSKSNFTAYVNKNKAYFDTILNYSSKNEIFIKVIPYLCNPDNINKTIFKNKLISVIKTPINLSWHDEIKFNEEDKKIVFEENETINQIIPIFDFSCTIEEETHMAFLQNLTSKQGYLISNVILDVSSFKEKVKTLADKENRYESKLKSWEALISKLDSEVKLIQLNNTINS